MGAVLSTGGELWAKLPACCLLSSLHALPVGVLEGVRGNLPATEVGVASQILLVLGDSYILCMGNRHTGVDVLSTLHA